MEVGVTLWQGKVNYAPGFDRGVLQSPDVSSMTTILEAKLFLQVIPVSSTRSSRHLVGSERPQLS